METQRHSGYTFARLWEGISLPPTIPVANEFLVELPVWGGPGPDSGELKDLSRGISSYRTQNVSGLIPRS